MMTERDDLVKVVRQGREALEEMQSDASRAAMDVDHLCSELKEMTLECTRLDRHVTTLNEQLDQVRPLAAGMAA